MTGAPPPIPQLEKVENPSSRGFRPLFQHCSGRRAKSTIGLMSLGPRVPIVQVDAFTDAPFSGNPAAVCVLDAPRDEHWMQHVAAEMNLAETAYPTQAGRWVLDCAGSRLPWKWICAATPRSLAPTCCGKRDASRPASKRAFTHEAAY